MCLRLLGLWAVALWLCAVLSDTAESQDCPTPVLTNGYFVSEQRNFSHDTQLHYACEEGYKPVENNWWATITCQNGHWDAQPQCIEKSACFDPEIPNANYTKVSYVAHKEKLWIRCNTGYEAKNRRGTALCENGEWKVLPVCEKTNRWCGPPPQIPNTVIVNQVYKELFPEDAEVEYNCQDGFDLERRNSKAYCSFGRWQSLPSCTPSISSSTAPPINTGSDAKPMLTTIDHCGTPPLINHGEFSYDESNMFVTYECNVYYKLRGSSKVMCYSNGQWSNLPTCEVNFCTLDTSRYDHLENTGGVFVISGTKVTLACFDSTWTTARAECKDNELRLTKCCYTITHKYNNCGYVQLKK